MKRAFTKPYQKAGPPNEESNAHFAQTVDVFRGKFPGARLSSPDQANHSFLLADDLLPSPAPAVTHLSLVQVCGLIRGGVALFHPHACMV